MDITIRRINTEDHYNVEYMTKRAFWNLNMPGCDEHYLVHRIWNEPDYVSSISLLAEIEGVIVGVILYIKCRVETENGDFPVLTFGPLCVDPEYQKKGIGSRLLVESMELARQQNYKGIRKKKNRFLKGKGGWENIP